MEKPQPPCAAREIAKRRSRRGGRRGCPREINNRTRNDAAVSLLKEFKAGSQSDLHTPVHCGTIYKSQEAKTAQIFVEGGLDKRNGVRTHDGRLFGLKKKSRPMLRQGRAPRPSCETK